MFREFGYKTLQEVEKDCSEMGLGIQLSDDFEVFKKNLKINNKVIPNSLAVHPMEGCDGKEDGGPGELTVRRYDRFARGGAGLIWFEAVSVVPEGRAAKRQLWISENNAEEFGKLYQNMVSAAAEEFGKDFKPLCIMQLTHSGRFSRPEGKPAPIIACSNPCLNERFKNEDIAQIISDDELEKLEEDFVKAALLAKKAGFDGIDIKACHRYLNSELLSAFTREGMYGGSFEGRTRFLANIADKIRKAAGDEFIVATRLNIYDGIQYPYGWGVDGEDYRKPDLTEPLKLVEILHRKGVRLINLTMGTPYYNPHVNRPYDKGGYIPDEHPLIGVSRLISGAGEIQKAFPDMLVVGTGYSWLRQLSPYFAAGSLKNGFASIIGYGREAFAYPDFARDMLEKQVMERERCCISCGKCTEILRAGGTAGCVIRDSEVYSSIYRECCK